MSATKCVGRCSPTRGSFSGARLGSAPPAAAVPSKPKPSRRPATVLEWVASPDALSAAKKALAKSLADASLDNYTPPNCLPPEELRGAQAVAKQRVESVMRAHAVREGQMVAMEMGLLDKADCALSTEQAKRRLWRKFYFKELGVSLTRCGTIAEAHRAFCAAGRSCDGARDFYARWVQSLIDGNERALAEAVAELGVCKGVFEFSAQRPASDLIRGLRWPGGANGGAGPWYDPAKIPAAVELVKAYPEIRAQYEQLRDGRTARKAGGFEAYPSPAVAPGGLWSDYMLVHAGKRDAGHCASMSAASSLLCTSNGPLRRDAAAMLRGSAFFSRMSPGTHLRTHCGPTNLRLRVHLGVDVPTGGWKIRVGDKVRAWKQGECLVFDDSYEHEVWHEPTGDATVDAQTRVVLIVDIWHPAISQQQRRDMLTPDEQTYFDSILRGQQLVAMTERELSDGSTRRVRGD